MFYNENSYNFLCSSTNPRYGKTLVLEILAKNFSANQIAVFLNQIYLQKKYMKQPHFLHSDSKSPKLKVDGNFWGGHGQERVQLVWSWESKSDCISRLNDKIN